MIITQTYKIPDNRCLNIQVPREIPTESVIITYTPVLAGTKTRAEESVTEKLNNYYQTHDSHLDTDLKAASNRLLAEVDW